MVMRVEVVDGGLDSGACFQGRRQEDAGSARAATRSDSFPRVEDAGVFFTTKSLLKRFLRRSSEAEVDEGTAQGLARLQAN